MDQTSSGPAMIGRPVPPLVLPNNLRKVQCLERTRYVKGQDGSNGTDKRQKYAWAVRMVSLLTQSWAGQGSVWAGGDHQPHGSSS